MKKIILIYILILLVSTGIAIANPCSPMTPYCRLDNFETSYSSDSCDSQGDFVKIARLMVNRGCGSMVCKRNLEYSHEYLLECVDGPGTTRYYQVWPSVPDVMGPWNVEQAY